MATKTVGTQVTTYDYDTLGNLTRVLLPNGDAITYTVDGRGRRLAKSVNGVRVRGWLYADQLRPIAELDSSGSVVARFVYGARSNVPEYVIKSGVTYRIFSDHLASPRIVLNAATGLVVQRLDFSAFGEVTQDSNPGWQPFGFAGGLFDPDTQLTRFGQRDYDAQTARWLTKDPIGFNGLDSNLYRYTFSDAVNHVDPNGLDVIVSGGVNATAGANAFFGVPFVGGGVNIGFNLSTGQFFIQVQANATVGIGAYAGVGLQGSVGWEATMPVGTQCSLIAETNAGWGPSGGGSIAVSPSGGSVSRSLPGPAGRICAGFGIHVGGGASTTTTWATPPIWGKGGK